jgi:2-iminobutanoate/2-iminopropanoate deaminase
VLSTADAQASAQRPSNVDESSRTSTRAAAAASSSQPLTAGDTQAVRYGDLLFVSGQIADDPASLAIVGSDIQTQVRTAMDKVARILESHGMAMSNVLSVTLYIQDLDELPEADAVYASYFRRSLPARSVVRVDGLPKGSPVEISVIAGR